MAKVLSRLDIVLFANTAQYRREMGDTQNDTKKMFAAMKDDAVELGKIGAAAFTAMAAAGVTAVGVMVQEQIAFASEISQTARIANTGVESMQKLAIAAKSVGVEQDTLGDIYKDTQDKIGDFLTTGGGAMADFFESLPPNVNLTAEAFRNLSGPEALQLYYDTLQDANLGQSEMIFYMEGMASDASLLIPLLQNGGAGFDLWAEAAENAGAIMDEKTIRATQELNTSTDLMMLSYDGAKKQFTQALMPVLSDVAGKLVGSGEASDIARIAGEKLVQGLKVLAATGLGVITIVKAIGKAIGGMAAVMAQWGNVTDGVDFSSPFAFFQLAKNVVMDVPLQQLKVMGDVVSDIKTDFVEANKTIEGIYALGTNGTNATVVALTDQKILRNEILGIQGQTGQQIQANAKAEEEAAKAAKKRADEEAKAAKVKAEAQARLVGISGNTGTSTGPHLDIRYAKGDPRRGQQVSAADIARFEAGGKALSSYRITSRHGNRNIGHGASNNHIGTDFAMPVGTNITTKVPVKDVKTWYDEGGGGYVSTITFADGVKINLLHQAEASKGIKGGSSGIKDPYNQANAQGEALLKQHQAEVERAAAEQLRFEQQQAQKRASIQLELADEVTRIELQRDKKIQEIQESGFTEEDQIRYTKEVTQRAEVDIRVYTQAQNRKLAALSDFTKSEEDLIIQNAQYRIQAIENDMSLTAEGKAYAMELVRQQTQHEIMQHQLVFDWNMQHAQAYQQTEAERIRNQYALERREIQLTINMDEQLRKAKIESIKAAEALALEDLRLSHQRELKALVTDDMSQLNQIKQQYAQQRADLDRRTDINDGQKSELRNQMAGAEQFAVGQYKMGVGAQVDSLQADLGGYSENYQLAEQYRSRLDIIKKGLEAEVLSEEEATAAKIRSRELFERQALALTMAGGQAILDNVTGTFKAMFGQQNRAYQVMFAAQQTFVMATAGLNMYDAWSDAMADGATMADKLAAAATITAEFGKIIGAASTIKLELPGFAKGGFTSGGVNDVAGYVHGKEFVANASVTKQYRPELEAMHNGTYDKRKPDNVNINVAVTVNSDGSASVESQSRLGSELGNALAAIAQKQIEKAINPGGLIYRQMR